MPAHATARLALPSFPIHMSNSALFFVPAAALLRPGPCFRFRVRPRRGSGGLLLSLSCPNPERGVGGAPGGALSFQSRVRSATTALARRGPSRATGTAPRGAPPWRFSTARPRVTYPAVPPDHAAPSRGSSLKGPSRSGPRSLPAAVAPQSRDATPRSACGRLRRRPSRARIIRRLA